MVKETLEDVRFKMSKASTMKKMYAAIENKYVDELLVPFLKKFNKKENYFTTSSCCGRIMLLGADEEETKQPKMFVGKWHRTVKYSEFYSALEQKTRYKEIWLKQESFIFHVVAKNLDFAKKILDLKADYGIRRGGIFIVEDGRYIIELIGSNNISVPIKFDNEILLNKKQLKILLKKANLKLTKNYKILKDLMKIFMKEL
jgi:tRNA wybutosine-synthesizing protein 3